MPNQTGTLLPISYSPGPWKTLFMFLIQNHASFPREPPEENRDRKGLFSGNFQKDTATASPIFSLKAGMGRWNPNPGIVFHCSISKKRQIRNAVPSSDPSSSVGFRPGYKEIRIGEPAFYLSPFSTMNPSAPHPGKWTVLFRTSACQAIFAARESPNNRNRTSVLSHSIKQWKPEEPRIYPNPASQKG